MNKYILLFLFACSFSNGQAQTFKAGAIIGLNASQIRGDASAGFNKLGIMGGLRVAVEAGDKIDVSLEMLYSQKGSYQRVTNNNPEEFRIIADYIDIPVGINYRDWLVEEGFYRLHFHGGISYGRLINAKTTDIQLEGTVEQFNENDISWFGGASYYFNENLALTGRYTRSLNLLFEGPNTGTNANSFLGFFLTFHILYMF